MTNKTSKVGSIADAVTLIPDGTRLAIGGFAIYQHPMAVVRALIRAGRRDLAIVGTVNGNEVDLLVGAGCVKRVETSYVGLEKYGLAPNFRRAVEEGRVEVVDYPEVLSFDRFRASQENFTFWPCDYLGGTDVLARNPDIKPFICPATGRTLHAVPPADPEVVVLHAIAADERGNVILPQRHLLPQGLDVIMARGCDTVIVTVEKIVPQSMIRRHAAQVQIPSYKTTLVVEAPWGAHPTALLGRYATDDAHFRDYVAASASPDGFAAYLDRYVHGPADHQAYLDAVGPGRLGSLTEFDTL
ncbi:CoA transferase subunit A [Azospirillum canadense]|uniref:CoA transferase subunit A n=1 Tax=Azospirillum canadense TaxID=403962 RepID=UPI002226B94C|nr:CoA-transferase [Azospirillum canadense]MCW2242129.1 glutaconate CoA-transferase subunit A [Azospirillum canadense]